MSVKIFRKKEIPPLERVPWGASSAYLGQFRNLSSLFEKNTIRLPFQTSWASLPRMRKITPHVHSYLSVVFVLSGRGEIVAPGERIGVGPASIVLIPEGLEHFVRSGPAPLHTVSVQFGHDRLGGEKDKTHFMRSLPEVAGSRKGLSKAANVNALNRALRGLGVRVRVLRPRSRVSLTQPGIIFSGSAKGRIGLGGSKPLTVNQEILALPSAKPTTLQIHAGTFIYISKRE